MQASLQELEPIHIWARVLPSPEMSLSNALLLYFQPPSACNELLELLRWSCTADQDKGSWKYSGLLLFNEHLQWHCLHGDGAYWSETLRTSLEVLHMQSNYWGLPSTPATHLSSLVSLRPSKSYFTILSGHSLRPTFPAPVVLCCPSTYWQRGACFSNLFFNNRQVNSINGKGLIPRNRRGNWHHPSSQTLVCFYQWSIVYKELFRLGNMAGSCPRRRRFDPLRWRRSAFLLAWNRMIAYNMVSKQWFRVFEKINMYENVEFFYDINFMRLPKIEYLSP